MNTNEYLPVPLTGTDIRFILALTRNNDTCSKFCCPDVAPFEEEVPKLLKELLEVYLLLSEMINSR